MESVNPFPEIMSEARTDLSSHITGDFSPEDWSRILREAEGRFRRRLEQGERPASAWSAVVLEFHRENNWGFRADYSRPRRKKNGDLGLGLVWMTFSAFVLTLMALAWLGQNYTASDDPKDAFWFFVALGAAIFNFVYFLWRGRNYSDR